MSDSAIQRLYVHHDAPIIQSGMFRKWTGAVQLDLHESEAVVTRMVVGIELPKHLPNTLGYDLIADFIEYDGRVRILRGTIRQKHRLNGDIHGPFA